MILNEGKYLQIYTKVSWVVNGEMLGMIALKICDKSEEDGNLMHYFRV